MTQISLSQNHRRRARSVWKCLSHTRFPVVASVTVALETRATWSWRACCSRFMFPNLLSPTRSIPHVCGSMPATHKFVARMLITKIQNHHRLTLAHHLVIRIINKHVCDNLWVADIHHYTSLWIYLEQHAGRDQITRVTRATIAEVVGDGHATGSMGLEA
jgi:hypothetical protein